MGINTSSIWLIGGLLNAVSTGFAVQVAQYTGAQDMDSARKVVRQAVRFCAFLGILLMGATMLIAPDPPADGRARNPRDAGLYLRIFCMALPSSCSAMVFSAILRCTGDMKTPWSLQRPVQPESTSSSTTLFHLPHPHRRPLGAPSPFGARAIGTGKRSVIAAIFVAS